MSKFCANCRHMRREAVDYPAKCFAPQNWTKALDLVTGETSDKAVTSEYCSAVRIPKAACGPDGNWFEPKVIAGEAA